MAQVKLEAGTSIAGISGRIGNLVFRVSTNGTTYVQQVSPAVRGLGSAAQQASFEGRTYYAPFVRPESFASVCSVALADFLKPPQILQV